MENKTGRNKTMECLKAPLFSQKLTHETTPPFGSGIYLREI